MKNIYTYVVVIFLITLYLCIRFKIQLNTCTIKAHTPKALLLEKRVNLYTVFKHVQMCWTIFVLLLWENLLHSAIGLFGALILNKENVFQFLDHFAKDYQIKRNGCLYWIVYEPERTFSSRIIQFVRRFRRLFDRQNYMHIQNWFHGKLHQFSDRRIVSHIIEPGLGSKRRYVELSSVGLYIEFLDTRVKK